MNANAKNDGRLPIFLGVTGHRDLRAEDLKELEETVESIFTEIRNRYKHSPIALLSPLAEGADRLVARVALRLGVCLVVPLPMPIEEYKRDFKSQESIAEFEDMLGRAEKYFELPLVYENTAESIREYGFGRDRQYTQVGAYVARHSQILIALWDGVKSEKRAGTATIVGFRLNGIPEPYAPARSPLDHVEKGPVYHIVTPRAGKGLTEGDPFFIQIHHPKESEDVEEPVVIHTRILQRIDNYNCDIIRLETLLWKGIEESNRGLIPDNTIGILTPEQRTILGHYACADRLAIHFQAKSKRAYIGLLIFVVTGFVSFQIYLELFKHPYVLMLYPMALAIAYSFFYIAKKHDYQNKHLDYRAVAEGQRVNLFWNIAGLKDDVAEYYLRKQKNELDWIRQAIRNVSTLVREWGNSARKDPEGGEHAHINILLDHWVNAQRDYFILVCNRDRMKLERQEKRVKLFYWTGIGLAVGMLIIHGYVTKLEMLHHVFIISIAVTLVLAATINNYMEKAAYSEQFKQYQRMKDIFTRASDYLRKALKDSNMAKVQEIVRELGKEALMENGDWVLLHRSRPIEVPKG